MSLLISGGTYLIFIIYVSLLLINKQHTANTADRVKKLKQFVDEIPQWY